VITALDTNVLIDVFGPDPVFGESSKRALRAALNEGSVIACEVVWSEIGGLFASPEAARSAMTDIPVEYSSMAIESALAAGSAWKAYHRRGGARRRMVADFLVGAHALRQAERLLTRDRGFYRAYFSGLRVFYPSRS
jgi:hypothetical protein